MSETLLSLDIAARLGWARGPLNGRPPMALEFGRNSIPMPDCGVVQLGEVGCEVGRFLSVFDEWLDIILTDTEPTMVIYESPIFPDPEKTTLTTLEKLYGASAHLQMVLHRAGIRKRRVQPRSVKKSFTGDGWASKEDMVAECQRRGWDVTDHNVADALGCYYHGVALVAKERRSVAA